MAKIDLLVAVRWGGQGKATLGQVSCGVSRRSWMGEVQRVGAGSGKMWSVKAVTVCRGKFWWFEECPGKAVKVGSV